MFSDLATYLFRAACVIALSIAPRGLSPDPSPPASAGAALVIAIVALGGLLGAGALIKRHIDALEGRVAAGLVWATVPAGIIGAIVAGGPSVPLLAAARWVGLVSWPALAAVLAALAGRYLGNVLKNRRRAAAALTIAAGIFVHADGFRTFPDARSMWKRALELDPKHSRARAALAGATAGAGTQAASGDAAARFEAALAADQAGKYNDARQGYLAALRLDPTLKAARAKLVWLTYKRGVLPEAQHHAQKLLEMDPNDPEAQDLFRMVQSAPTSGAQPDRPPASSAPGP